MGRGNGVGWGRNMELDKAGGAMHVRLPSTAVVVVVPPQCDQDP